MLVFLAMGGSLMARDLKTNDGKVYQAINIVGKQVNGLKVVHSKGTHFIKFTELPPDIQEEFGYDEQKSLKYEKYLEDQVKKRNNLATKRKNDQLKAVNKTAEVKKDILKNGDLLYFVRKQLINLNGTKQVYNLPTLGTVCPGNGKYMIYGQRVYRVKDNVIPVDDKIKELNAQVVTFKKEVEACRLDIASYDDKVSLNLNRISKVMSSTGSSALNGVSDDSGTVLINDLSSTQKRFIRDLERDNRQFDRDTRKLESKIEVNRSLIKRLTSESMQLQKKLSTFKNSQKKLTDIQPGGLVTSDKSSEQPSILKSKLIELKKLFKEGYISKEIYDTKSKELLDELF